MHTCEDTIQTSVCCGLRMCARRVSESEERGLRGAGEVGSGHWGWQDPVSESGLGGCGSSEGITVPMIPLGLKETKELDWSTPLKVSAAL